MFLEALEAAPMGGRALGHLGPSKGHRDLLEGHQSLEVYLAVQ